MFINNFVIWLLANDQANVAELVNKILSILMPIIMVIAFGTATVFTAIAFISGFGDIDGLAKKNKIKQIIWIWVCCGGVFATSTIMLCLKGYFMQLVS